MNMDAWNYSHTNKELREYLNYQLMQEQLKALNRIADGLFKVAVVENKKPFKCTCGNTAINSCECPPQ